MKQIKTEMKVPEHNPGHVLKLLNKITEECSSNYFDMNSRKQIAESIEAVANILKDQENRDDDFHNIPENKINNLRREIEGNDKMLKKNQEDLRHQIQERLYMDKVLSPGMPWYDTIIMKAELEMEEIEIKLKHGIETAYPTFSYQKDSRWIEIQLETLQKNLKAIKESLNEMHSAVEIAKQKINEQNDRMTARREQALDELRELGIDVSEYLSKPAD